MEDSTFQAIYTGVYIFIFVAAVTTTLYMFRNVNELAENAYNYSEVSDSDSVIKAPSEEYELSGSDLISYIYNYMIRDKFDNSSDAYDNSINLTFQGVTINTTNYNSIISSIDNFSKYIITYNGMQGSKQKFTISKK